jgi:Tn3 transposase DDE domain
VHAVPRVGNSAAPTTPTTPPALVSNPSSVEDVPDHLLAHLSPLGWEHINLTGDYVWVAPQEASENNDELRPLRTSPEAFRKAA